MSGAEHVAATPVGADVQGQAIKADDNMPGAGVVVEISDAPETYDLFGEMHGRENADLELAQAVKGLFADYEPDDLHGDTEWTGEA